MRRTDFTASLNVRLFSLPGYHIYCSKIGYTAVESFSAAARRPPFATLFEDRFDDFLQLFIAWWQWRAGSSLSREVTWEIGAPTAPDTQSTI